MRVLRSFFLANLVVIYSSTATLAVCSMLDLDAFKAKKEKCLRGCSYLNGAPDTVCQSDKCGDYTLGRPKDCPPDPAPGGAPGSTPPGETPPGGTPPSGTVPGGTAPNAAPLSEDILDEELDDEETLNW